MSSQFLSFYGYVEQSEETAAVGAPSFQLKRVSLSALLCYRGILLLFRFDLLMPM